MVWALTFGKHHFWFLPNLTEDVGFFDSFKPLYKHETITKEEVPEKDKKAVKSGEKKSEESTKVIAEALEEAKPDEKDESEKLAPEDSGSELDISQDNGYEFVNPEDVEANGEDDDEEEEDERQEDEGEEDDQEGAEESPEPKKTR